MGKTKVENLQGEKETCATVSRRLGKHTCMHGVPNIARASGPFRRWIWSIITLAGLAGLVWQLLILGLKFSYNPVSTEVTIVPDYSLDFPMVSICNMNPLRMSALADAPKDLQDIYGYKDGIIVDEQDSSEEEQEVTKKTAGWSRAVNQTDYFSTHSKKHTQKLKMLYEMRQLNSSQQDNLSHNITWLLLACQYNGFLCTPDNFTRFFNPFYGNCYAFNTGLNEEILKTSRPGPIYGLILELYIEQSEYITDYTAAAGVKVVIGNQSDMPYPEDEGMSVTAGSQSSISLSRINIHRASPPHGTCRDYRGHEGLMRNLYIDDNPLNIRYSDRVCFKTCYQINIIRICGCCNPSYPCSGYAVEREFNYDPPYCSPNDTASAKCVLDMNQRYQNGSLDCKAMCPPACDEVTYSSEISAAVWPTKRMVMSVAERVAVKTLQTSKLVDALNEKDHGDVAEYLYENVLKLEIFYRKLNYESLATYASYTVGDMLSDFGGQLGLWLGLSAITLFELIEYIIDLIIVACKRKQRESVDPNKG